MTALAEIPSPMGWPNTSLARYVIDASVSRFTVRAFATGLLSLLGHNLTIGVRGFEGEVLHAQDSLDSASLHIRINASSLEVQDQMSDKDRSEMEHLMRDNVLEVHRFPHIVYQCSKVSGDQIDPSQCMITLDGELTLHGVTRSQPVHAQVNIADGLLRASGESTLRQTDYGIKLVSALGGTLRVKDELKLVFDLAARRQISAREAAE